MNGFNDCTRFAGSEQVTDTFAAAYPSSPTLSRAGWQALDRISQLREIGIRPMISVPPTGNDGNNNSGERGPRV
jgi:hypothetical protein